MRNRDESDMDGMRQGIPRGFNSATTTCNGENGPGRGPSGLNGGESGEERHGDSDPAEPRRSRRFERSVGTRQQF